MVDPDLATKLEQPDGGGDVEMGSAEARMPSHDSANDAADATSLESASWRGVTIVNVHHDDSDHRSAVRAAYPSSMGGDAATATRATPLPFAQEAKRRIDEGAPIDWSNHIGDMIGTNATRPTTGATDVTTLDRPTAVSISPDHIDWDGLALNFGLLAAREAPTVTKEWIIKSGRKPALLMVPIAHTGEEPCAMVCLNRPDAIFGAARDERQGGAEQGAILAAHLSGGIETQYASPAPLYGANDAVILVPWAARPTFVARSAANLATARDAGLDAAWCTLDALHDHVAYHAVSLAFMRISTLTSIGEHGEQRAGIWEYARPIVSTRTAHEWAARADLPADETICARARFMEAELARGRELRSLLIAQDTGNGALIAMADSVRTAADYEDEIPFPANGLPTYVDSTLRLAPFAERPLSLSTTWLARLPPQQVPPGFKPMTWQGILRGWALRKICIALNATADRDYECYEKGSSARRRPAYVCIGPGGGKEIAHADGIGSYNALSIVYELDPSTGLYDKMDFQRPGRTHWNLGYLKEAFGIHDDQQLMSLVMHGVRWGVQAPLQIRIAANLERLDARIRGVGEAFKKLIAKGLYYKYKKLRRAHEQISPDGPGPFIIIPSYIVGTGGTDKPDNPNEKRIIGDQGAPHADQRVHERNAPHGDPDGPAVTSLNDMMGPEPGSVPRGSMLDSSRYPMPHPESKVRPRQAYGDSAVLSHMAHVNKTYLAGFKSDGRHMFFQFEMAPEEERTCSFTSIIPFPLLDDGGKPILDEKGNAIVEHWFTLIVATCMNMGSRNASKIAQRFTDRLLEAFSQQLDIFVRDSWLPHQTPELRALLAERATTLGPRQARPFKTSGYTDDYEFEFVGPELFAAGARIWIDMCHKANYWLSEKASAGTVIDFIGGRLVLNGGFGCLSPSKHARAVADSMAVCGGTITREALESHNSFLVHVHDWLDFPAGTLKGLSAPLKIPGTPEQRAEISERVRAQHEQIIALVHARRAASFWSGVNEALRGLTNAHAALAHVRFNPRFSSDACSDVAQPFICGVCCGVYFRFALDGDWRRRHITVTEACGTVLTLMVLSKYFPEGEIMIESDASASLATTRATADAPDLIYLRRRAEAEETFRAATRRAWLTHCKGWANGLADAGSRDKMHEMHALADAFGIRLREVPIPPEALAFMRDVLANSTERTENEGVHDTSMGTHNLSMIGDMPIAQPNTLTLLAYLNLAIERGAGRIEVVRRAIDVATYLGAVIPINAVDGITAACLCIMQPARFKNCDEAARACGCSRSNCFKWRKLLRDKIQDEQTNGAASSGTVAGSTALSAQPTVEETAAEADSLAEAETIASLILLGHRSPSVELDLREAPPRSAAPPSIPPSPPVMTPVSKQGHAQTQGSAPATTPSTHKRAESASTCGDQPSACGIGAVDAIEELIDVEAATEAINAAADLEQQQALEMMRNVEAEDMLCAWSAPRDAPCSQTDLASLFGDVELRLDEDSHSRHDRPGRGWSDLPELPQARTELCDGVASHDTSMGRHNLSMIGDMPIAQGVRGMGGATSPSPEPRPGARPLGALKLARSDRDAPSASNAARRLGPSRARIGNGEGISPESNPKEIPQNLGGRSKRTNDALAPREALTSPDLGPFIGHSRGSKRTTTTASLDDGEDLISALAKRRSPRKLRAEESTAYIDDAIAAHPTRARASSPQPDNATDARRRAARDVAQRLIAHDSSYALFPDRPEVLRGIVIDAAAAREAGIPRGTASSDEWGFQWVRKFGLATNNRWMRPRAALSAEDALCEVWFAILALVWIAQMIAPSTRRKMAGYGQGMPTSALLALYGWRRVMLACGRYVADLTQVRAVLKGICARYKARWGDDAFVRSRKQPFTTAHLIAIVALLESANQLVTWTAVLRQAVLVAFCHALSTGARKDEWTASFEGDTFVRRCNFNWVDKNGNDLPNTAATVASRKNGDLLRGRSAPSKCDRLNIEWGARDMWFRYDDQNPLNFAWRWRQWEEAHPCPASERARWPAFSPSGDGRPFTGGQADGLLRVVLGLVMTAAEAAQRTWHSCRITLATRLFARRGEAHGIARDEIEGVIQSLVRWKTVEAMRIYARMQPDQYADYVDMGTDSRPSTGGDIPADLPEVDPEGILTETQATIDAIDTEEIAKAKVTRAAREAEAPRAAAKRSQRRTAPPTGGISATAAEPEARRRAYDIGEGQAIFHIGDDSWGIIGQQLRVHNSFWGWEDNEYSDCRVVGYAGEHRFASDKLSKYTYVIEYEGYFYPATHTTVAGALIDAAVKRRIKKAPAPRLL